MLMKEKNDMISQDDTLVVNDIQSAILNLRILLGGDN